MKFGWDDNQRFGDDLLNHKNPYAAETDEPQVPEDSAVPPPRTDSNHTDRFLLEAVTLVGHQLEVPRRVVLPRICVATGETGGLALMQKKLRAPSVLLMVAGAFVGPLLSVLFAWAGARCNVSFYVSRQHQVRRLTAKLMGAFGILLSLAGVISTAWSHSPLVLMLSIAVLLLSLLLFIWGSRSFLHVTWHRQGRFRLAGFCDLFLDRTAAAIAGDPELALEAPDELPELEEL